MHVRFPKIPQSSTQWIGQPHGVNSESFVVTEKVHGANFSVVAAPGGDVSFASRGGIIDDRDNFFGVRSTGMTETLAVRARALHDAMVRNHAVPASATIIIYGELAKK